MMPSFVKTRINYRSVRSVKNIPLVNGLDFKGFADSAVDVVLAFTEDADKIVYSNPQIEFIWLSEN